MYVYTIIITICKIGAIWARKIVVRKTFQSIGTVAFMVMVIQSNENKKSKDNYDRKRNRRIHAKSIHRSEKDR